MEIINSYIVYLYILLGIICLIVFFVLLSRTRRIANHVKETLPQLQKIGQNIASDKEKLARIQASKDSWSFFASLSVIFIIIRETLQAHRKDTYGKSLSRSLVRHAGQLRNIRF